MSASSPWRISEDLHDTLKPANAEGKGCKYQMYLEKTQMWVVGGGNSVPDAPGEAFFLDALFPSCCRLLGEQEQK